MELNEGIRVRGDLTLILERPDGTKKVTQNKNMILNGGFDFICDAIGNPSRGNPISHIALGTSTTAADPAQTGLLTEIARLSGTYSHTTNTKYFTLTAAFPAGVATGNITEACVVNAGSGGTKLNRLTFTAVDKQPDDTLMAIFTFTLA